MNKIQMFMIQAVTMLIALSACTSEKRYKIQEISVSRVLMDKSFDTQDGQQMQALVDSFKVLMDAKMCEEIGFSAQDLVKGKPQSLLGNFTADAMFDFGKETWGNVDFAITNIGGIRATLNKGEITVGELYEIYPFENQIVCLELKSASVEKLFRTLASKAGEVLSKNIEFVINGKDFESLKIGGKLVDKDKIYRVVTVDYLAEGNDNMSALTEAVTTLESNVLIRDVIISNIRKLTSANRKVESQLDNRIKIK
ncbi:MAG: 5'-nucleotidase C-terminal domain-containing protein [Dysgonamonadaceae bacterium]|jgi:2',3'-cyclic-nucleotide 2'-phosphodiesterase (5'-nucleotidase family)|nr:5'-nucleotidase C-terminal domain-containing protein [Dysgonamonadaceae bacterium]